MGQILSNLIGLGRHADCKNCEIPVAEQGGNKSNRWTSAPVIPPNGKRGQLNADGSVNLDGLACNASKTGKHQPRPGSLR